MQYVTVVFVFKFRFDKLCCNIDCNDNIPGQQERRGSGGEGRSVDRKSVV